MRTFKCVLCGKEYDKEWNHNPAPLSKEGRCCNECNYGKVLPARLEAMYKIIEEQDEHKKR